MQYGTTSCQLPRPRTSDSPRISTPQSDPHRVAPNQQWLNTTTGRIATCPHSWMQAVHWISGSGLYTPSRNHGPKWGPTTLLIAQEIKALTECRPGVDYLARKLKVSERTVQYHLDMLREAGLLAYITKGTRISGVGGQASEFARTIPTVFDTALGIRTLGEGPQRRPVGIAAEHRSTIGKLARKAARKVRRRTRKPSSSASSRCTPMQGCTSTSSTAAITTSPSESKLASGNTKSPTRKKPNHKPRKLNKVGRRHQLAGELIQHVGWLSRANRERIAWIVRHVSDAGWTVHEVMAWLDTTQAPDAAMRPSGLLAYRLRNAHQVPGWTTTEGRAAAVEEWRDSRRAAKAARVEWDSDWQEPSSRAVQRLVNDAIRSLRQPADEDDGYVVSVDDGPPALETLPRELIADMRADAMRDPALVLMLIDSAGEAYARRLYTNRLVELAKAVSRSPRMTVHAW